MFKKIASAAFVLGISTVSMPIYADNSYSCSVEVAVASPPVLQTEKVAFNINNEYGISRSITVSGGEAPKTVEKLLCSTQPYLISATLYPIENDLKSTPGQIGQCMLKAGPVYMAEPKNSISVVFPNDFICE